MKFLLYDNDCSFCSSIVSFVKKRAGTSLQYVPLISNKSDELRKKYSVKDIDSVILISEEKEKVLYKSEAIAAVLLIMPFPWKLLVVMKIIPRFFRDRVYNVIARYRHKFIKKQTCSIEKSN